MSSIFPSFHFNITLILSFVSFPPSLFPAFQFNITSFLSLFYFLLFQSYFFSLFLYLIFHPFFCFFFTSFLVFFLHSAFLCPSSPVFFCLIVFSPPIYLSPFIFAFSISSYRILNVLFLTILVCHPTSLSLLCF